MPKFPKSPGRWRAEAAASGFAPSAEREDQPGVLSPWTNIAADQAAGSSKFGPVWEIGSLCPETYWELQG